MTDRPYPVAALEKRVFGKLDRVELVVVKLPFVSPFGTSVHVWTHKEALLMRVCSEGLTAWSECVCDPDPFYAYETTSTARHILKDFLLPLVEPGMTLGSLEERSAKVRGHAMAKATLENALLTLIALKDGLPLRELLGGADKKVPSGLSIGLKDSPAELMAAVEEGVAKGYHRIKLKVKKGQDVDWVRAVRERFPDIRLMVDANGDYTLADAALLARLDAFNLMMIEQPLSYSDIYQHSLLQRRLKTALCLDESILGLDDAAAAIALGACRVINIKQGRVGGLLESRRIARYAALKGLPSWSGGMDETGIGRAVNIHLQTDPDFSIPGDTAETARYFHEDLVEPPVTLGPGGWISVPAAGPGIGVEPLPERLDRLTIARRRLK